MGGVRTDTRGRMLKGVMDCRHPCRHPFPGCSYWHRLPLAPLFPEALKGWISLSLSSLLLCLGWRGFGLRGLWGFGWPEFGCPGGPVKIRVSTYCETGPASGIYMGSEGKTPEQNTKTEMKTETVTVPTNTLAGLRKAERLQAAGWAQIRVTLFSVTFSRRVSR